MSMRVKERWTYTTHINGDVNDKDGRRLFVCVVPVKFRSLRLICD